MKSLIKGEDDESQSTQYAAGGQWHGCDPAATGPLAAQSVPTPSQAAAEGTPAPASVTIPSTNHRLNIVTLRDLEAEAQKVLPAYSFAYVSGGAGDEWTMRENEEAMNRWVIESNYISGHLTPDLTTTLLAAASACRSSRADGVA